MKLLENILYLEFAELVEAGVSPNTITSAKQNKTKGWNIIPDPSDARSKLIQYEPLADRYKKLIAESRFKNPYDYVAKTPIRNYVQTDFKAEEFFIQYRFPDGGALPIEFIKKYVVAASWLNALIKAESSKKELKKSLGLPIAKFWEHVKEIIATDEIALPSCYKRLKEKLTEYRNTGYGCLISGKFGTQNRAKVNDETSSAVLLEMISNARQHDDTIIARAYNAWAEQNGYDTITAQTVGNHRRKNNFQLQGFREGNSAWFNDYGKQIIRKRPSAPLLLVGSDDNDLDLYFKEVQVKVNKKTGKKSTETNHYYRFKLYMVMDAFNDYPLGFAYGDTISIDLIKAAYLDAIHHVRELTGGWYNPNQIQTDHWGLDKNLEGELASYLKSLATFTPATVKVSRAKYIERAFGVQWHQVLKLYPNYAGTNITSQSRLNKDNLEVAKKDFPTKEQAPAYIEDFVTRMRLLVNPKSGKSRQQEWLDGFWESDLSREHQLSDARMLMLYGMKHSHTNSITNGGLKVTINGEARIYDVPDELYLQHVGKSVQVYYDPFDYSRVLVMDNDKLRFVAREYEALPSAIADFKEGDRHRLNQRLEQKLRHVALISTNKEKRTGIVERQLIDIESQLQANVLVKELKYKAENNYQQLTNDRQGYNPLNQM